MIGLLMSASVLILVVIVLRRVLRGRISLRLQYALWLLVAIRLLIPFEFGSSPLSLQNLKPNTSAEAPAEIELNSTVLQPPVQQTPVIVEPIVDVSPMVSEPVISDPIASSPVIQDEPLLPDKPVISEPAAQAEAFDWARFANIAWAVGAGVMAFWMFVVNGHFRRSAKKHARQVQVEGYPLPVFITNEIPSACLVGFIRPKVYLTPMDDATARNHVLTHELTHYRHFDPLWALVRALCLCLYWFHPLVWWAAVLSKRDCELACDEGALQKLGEAQRIPYGRTLLSMVTRAGRPYDLLQTATTMSESKKQLKQRVEMIVKRPKKLWTALICLILVIGITVGCTFTGAEPEPLTTEPTQTTEPTETTEATDPTEPTQKFDLMDSSVETYLQEGEYSIPKLNTEVFLGNRINNEILEIFGDTEKYQKIDYSWSKHNALLSLVVFAETKDGTAIYSSYNVDLQRGEFASHEQALGENYNSYFYSEVPHELSTLFAKDLYAGYVETGKLTYDADTDVHFNENFTRAYSALPPYWLDEDGVIFIAAEYCNPKGERKTVPVAVGRGKAYPQSLISELIYEEISFPTPTDDYFTEEYTLRIPFLLMPGERVAEINGELLLAYHSRYISVDYSIAENGDIISIVANGVHAEMPFDNPYVYNISKSSGLDVPAEEVYAAGGLDAQSYPMRVKEVMLNACIADFPDYYENLEFIPTIIGDTLSDENVARCIPYLDENGKLWIKANIYQTAGAECLEHLLPVTDAVFTEEYYNYLASH